jgi:hypothetical protein
VQNLRNPFFDCFQLQAQLSPGPGNELVGNRAFGEIRRDRAFAGRNADSTRTEPLRERCRCCKNAVHWQIEIKRGHHDCIVHRITLRCLASLLNSSILESDARANQESKLRSWRMLVSCTRRALGSAIAALPSSAVSVRETVSTVSPR